MTGFSDIKQIVDKIELSHQAIARTVSDFGAEVKGVKTDVSSLKEDVSNLKEDVGNIKAQISTFSSTATWFLSIIGGMILIMGGLISYAYHGDRGNMSDKIGVLAKSIDDYKASDEKKYDDLISLLKDKKILYNYSNNIVEK